MLVEQPNARNGGARSAGGSGESERSGGRRGRGDGTAHATAVDALGWALGRDRSEGEGREEPRGSKIRARGGAGAARGRTE